MCNKGAYSWLLQSSPPPHLSVDGCGWCAHFSTLCACVYVCLCHRQQSSKNDRSDKRSKKDIMDMAAAAQAQVNAKAKKKAEAAAAKAKAKVCQEA